MKIPNIGLEFISNTFVPISCNKIFNINCIVLLEIYKFEFEALLSTPRRTLIKRNLKF